MEELILTFNNIATPGDIISFSYYPFYPNTDVFFGFPMGFGNNSINSEIGTDAITQAELYYNKILENYPTITNNFNVVINSNIVTFTALNNLPIIFNPLINTTAINNTQNDFVILPTSFETNIFTLNREVYALTTDSTNTFFQFDIEVKVYNLYSNQYFDLYNIPFKLIPFKGIATIEIGKLIHKLISRIEFPDTSGFIYKQAEVRVSCQEKNLINNQLVRAQGILPVKYIAGRRSENFVAGFLNPNLKPESVNVTSNKNLNIFNNQNNYEINVFKNKIFEEKITLGDDVFGITLKRISFQNFTPGDIIEYVFQEINNDEPEAYNPIGEIKSFCMLPTQNYSTEIVWENIFLLQSVLDCRGSFMISSEFEQNTFKKYKNFVEVLEVLSVSKEVKFKINTGWLIKSDVDLIDSLLWSKKAWINAPSGPIEIIPQTKEMINENSDRELIEYSLEFIINKKYNEENYSL